MEQIGRRAFLYDFYGELLTEHQKEVYEDVVQNDMSLGEIAQELGISRQGVHDLVKRCDRILGDYEQKLHLVERFLKTKDDVRRILELSSLQCKGEDASERVDDVLAQIRDISGRILEEL